MAADGSIVIKTEVDDKQAQSELKSLEKKIDSLNEKIGAKKQAQIPFHCIPDYCHYKCNFHISGGTLSWWNWCSPLFLPVLSSRAGADHELLLLQSSRN